jgi:hypothetical protein
MADASKLYIIKLRKGTCEIVTDSHLQGEEQPDSVEKWGPFESRDEAIARRVGLIRAGKCQPQ